MTYDPDEEVTRPDLPRTVARRCKHCGGVYGDHAPGTKPRVKATCGGLRRDFDPEANTEHDHER